MVDVKKIKQRKFAFAPQLYDPDDLIAITSSVYGGLRKPLVGHCVSIYVHERHDEFGQVPGRHKMTIRLDARETKKLLESLVQTQVPSDLSRVLDSARRKHGRRHGRRK